MRTGRDICTLPTKHILTVVGLYVIMLAADQPAGWHDYYKKRQMQPNLPRAHEWRSERGGTATTSKGVWSVGWSDHRLKKCLNVARTTSFRARVSVKNVKSHPHNRHFSSNYFFAFWKVSPLRLRAQGLSRFTGFTAHFADNVQSLAKKQKIL